MHNLYLKEKVRQPILISHSKPGPWGQVSPARGGIAGKDCERLEVSVFSVPRCRFASDGISASLQQVAVFSFFLS
jgi:hypothetical protein